MIDIQLIFFILVAIGMLSVLTAGKRKLQVGFSLAVMLLSAGYRRAFVSRYIEIHPAEVVFWFLAVLLFVQPRQHKGQISNPYHLPKWLSVFMIFWLWGWVIAIFSNLQLDLIFNQFKPFLILPVIFWLTWKLLREPNGIYVFLRTFFIAGTLVAGTGLFEYYFPGLAGRIPGFSASSFSADISGFMRARFSFYGSPTATFMLVITTPLGLALWHQAISPRQKFMLLTGIAIQMLGIYIGGYRSMWLAMGSEIILLVMLYRGVFVGLFGLIPLAAVYQSLPSEALLRLSTLFLAAEGHAVDSSAINRLNRIDDALAMIQRNPFGSGWASSGWTHNDVLQIAVDLGVIAILIFIVAYLTVVFRLGKKALSLRKARTHADFQVTLAILLGFIGSGFLYVSQGVTWQIFLVLPAWLIWALAEYWTAEPPIVTLQENINAAQNIRTTPRFQQRRYNLRDPRINPLGGRDPRR